MDKSKNVMRGGLKKFNHKFKIKSGKKDKINKHGNIGVN